MRRRSAASPLVAWAGAVLLGSARGAPDVSHVDALVVFNMDGAGCNRAFYWSVRN